MHPTLASGVTKAFASALFAALFLWQRADDAAGAAACFGCASFMVFIVVGVIALHIILLVWVARDAKNRGMDNSVLWMVLVMITGLVGLIIYLCVRPQGSVVECPHCKNKRLQVSAKCPHCGNA